jgi:hypothetical protein
MGRLNLSGVNMDCDFLWLRSFKALPIASGPIRVFDFEETISECHVGGQFIVVFQILQFQVIGTLVHVLERSSGFLRIDKTQQTDLYHK